MLRGSQLALEHRDPGAVELVALDAHGADRQQQAIANARQAAGDPAALAYIGDFHSSQVLATSPILAEAGLLQIAPVATFAGLESPTLVLLMPHDGVGAKAIAAWLEEAGVQELLVVHDHDRGSRPVWNHDERPADDLGEAEAVLYVGVAGSGTVTLWHDLHAENARMWLLGAEGLAVPWLACDLEPSAAERTRFFVAQRAPFGFYGYEAMALAFDTLAMGRGDRDATVRAARSTRDRASILGRYSIDEHGHTTNPAYGRLAVVGGELVWDLD